MSIVLYHDMGQDILIDFGYCYIVMWCKCCLFLVSPGLFLTDDYLSQNVIWLIFCEITISHPYNTVFATLTP